MCLHPQSINQMYFECEIYHTFEESLTLPILSNNITIPAERAEGPLRTPARPKV